jgi:hypothetical protein
VEVDRHPAVRYPMYNQATRKEQEKAKTKRRLRIPEQGCRNGQCPKQMCIRIMRMCCRKGGAPQRQDTHIQPRGLAPRGPVGFDSWPFIFPLPRRLPACLPACLPASCYTYFWQQKETRSYSKAAKTNQITNQPQPCAGKMSCNMTIRSFFPSTQQKTCY